MHDTLSQFTSQLYTFVVPVGLGAIVIGVSLALIAKHGEKKFRKFIKDKFANRSK